MALLLERFESVTKGAELVAHTLSTSAVKLGATLLAFGLGAYGFSQAYILYGDPHGLGDCAYKALQLIVGQFPTELTDKPLPASLYIARWALPLITLWTTVTLGWRQVRNPLQSQMVRLRGDHLIVAGDGAIAGRVVKAERKAKRPVLVWTDDASQAWVQAAANQGAPSLEGTSAATVAKLGLAKARSLLVAGEDGAANVALVSAAVDAALKQRPDGDPLTMIARVDDPDLRDPLERRFNFAGERSVVRVRLASLPDIAARDMFIHLPLDRFQRGAEPDRTVFILGFSAAAERYVLRLLAAAHFRGGAKPKLVVLDTGAARKGEVFYARRPGAKVLAPVAFEEAPVDQPALLGAAMDRCVAAYGAPSAVFVDPPNPGSALALALAVEDRLSRSSVISPPIYARLPGDTADSDLSCGITPISAYGELADPEMMLQERLDALARSVHEFYLEGRLEEGDQIGSRLSMYPWDQLSEAVRDDNRLLTDCYELKLRDIGARLVTTVGEAGGFRFQPDELETLSRAEHDRWMAAKLLDGWVYGEKRDDVAKLHPDIVPYDDLSEPRKDLDREQIQVITRLLASSHKRAARDLVIALDGTGPKLTAQTIAAIAAQYPDRALVVMASFEDEAARTALQAAADAGLPIEIIVTASPETTLSATPRANRIPLRKLYRRADRIYAVTGEAAALAEQRAHLWLTTEAGGTSAAPRIVVNGQGAVTAAPWIR